MSDAPLTSWLAGPLPPGVPAVLERLQKTPGVVRIAVMPDVHLAGEFCVGTVVATERLLFPNAVGGDIGCGMLALRFDGAADALADEAQAAQVLGALSHACPARRHHRKTAPPLSRELCCAAMSDPRLDAIKSCDDTALQLGTLGAGNHFLELQSDDGGALWLMIHTGSRHLGQCVLQHHLPRAQRTATGLMALDAGGSDGQAYLHDVAIARAWAKENRRLLAMAAAAEVHRLLGFRAAETFVDCDHNHVEREIHGDGAPPLFIHRKGATAAGAGVPGIIPGSMGTRSFHTIGHGDPDSLCSSSHGAGRALSRTQAQKQITVSALRQQLRKVWYDARLERQLREEAPAAYKDIDQVMLAQKPLTRVIRRLTPRLVYKGA